MVSSPATLMNNWMNSMHLNSIKQTIQILAALKLWWKKIRWMGERAREFSSQDTRGTRKEHRTLHHLRWCYIVFFLFVLFLTEHSWIIFQQHNIYLNFSRAYIGNYSLIYNNIIFTHHICYITLQYLVISSRYYYFFKVRSGKKISDYV